MREKFSPLAPIILSGALLVGCASGGETSQAEAPATDNSYTPVSAKATECAEWPTLERPETIDPYTTATDTDLPVVDQNLPVILNNYFSDLPVEVVEPGYTYGSEIHSATVRFRPEEMTPVTQAVVERVLRAVVDINEAGADVGSGFIVHGPLNKPELVTAGHVLEAVMNPEKIEFTLNDGTDVEYDYYSYAYNDPWNEVELSSEEKTALSEDIGRADMCYDESLDGRSLPVRDLVSNPLKLGEPLLLVNFQDEHEVGDPAIYQMPYLGRNSIDPLFGELIGDVQPGVEEDDLRSGGSGGVVTDSSGNVVGISTASINYYDDPTAPQWHACGDVVLSSQPNAINGYIGIESISVIMPTDGDECDRGLSTGSFRRVEDFGGFLMNDNVEPVLVVNPDL